MNIIVGVIGVIGIIVLGYLTMILIKGDKQ